MPCETTNNRPSTPPLSRVQPLALALALAFASDASFADTAMATHAVPVGSRATRQAAAPKNAASPRPDGSIIWSVENCNDAGDGSLRDAAFHANHGDAIDLGALSCSTISVTSGAITLHDVELMGPGAAQLDIDGTGNQGHRIFNHVSAGGTLDISGVTVRGGTYVSNASQGGGCLRSVGGNLHITDSVFRSCAVVNPVGHAGYARGGAIAIYGDGEIRMEGTTIASNIARSDHQIALGGGIYAQGSVTLHKSIISNNWASSASGTAPNGGGGLTTNGSVWIEDSSLDGNTVAGDGGGAWVRKGGVLLRSTVSNNSSVTGASGIVILGQNNTTAGIYSSTISGNVSQESAQYYGGALYLDAATTTVVNSTITANSESNQVSTKFGAGIIFGREVVSVTMSGTIAAGNFFDDGEPPYAADDITGPATITILGDTNMVGWTNRPVPADTVFVFDPGLGPLQNNGGPTQTHLPLPGNPAIDHGAAHGYDTDQRGYARVVGVAADIGAVEVNADMIFANGFDLP